MNVDEARGVCKDRDRWRSVVSAEAHGEKGVSLCMFNNKYYSARSISSRAACGDKRTSDTSVFVVKTSFFAASHTRVLLVYKSFLRGKFHKVSF